MTEVELPLTFAGPKRDSIESLPCVPGCGVDWHSLTCPTGIRQ